MVSIGLEIECVYDSNKLNTPNTRGYHSGDLVDGTYWKIESDSSIRSTGSGYMDSPREGEFISKRLGSIDSLQIAIQKLKDMCKQPYELKEVMHFNESCGAHVHFSIPNRVSHRADYSLFKWLREEFFVRYEREFGINRAKAMRKQYFRSYAKELTKEIWANKSKRSSERGQEFNFSVEHRGRGMEWRSPNLLGIVTWDELLKFYEIIYILISEFKDKLKGYEVVEEIILEEKDVPDLKTRYVKNKRVKVKL